jgi:pimeloyl-ACP methyl ester carboxylesterase
VRLDRHGDSGPRVLVLHGGPGAPGSAHGLTRGLAAGFRILEPWQRGSAEGGVLTVAQLVDDLHALVSAECPGERPALVGHSWGAMLALAAAAAHPDAYGSLVIVGCGTFDPAARAHFQATLAERGGEALAQGLAALADEPEADRRLAAAARLLEPLYGVDLEPEPPGPVDARANAALWADMLAQQAAGVYPAAFAAIRAPVLMLHGEADPHPGAMIRDSLLPFLPQLEYRELPRCGHSPWREREARAAFVALLEAWLARQSN